MNKHDFQTDEQTPILRPLVESVLIGASEPGIPLKQILGFCLAFALIVCIGIVDSLITYKRKFPDDMWLRFWIEDATPSGRRKQYLEKIEIERNRRPKPITQREV